MFRMEINTENDAFQINGEKSNVAMAYEIDRIMNSVRNGIRHGFTEGQCVDINGNVVGRWSVGEE